MQAIGMSFEVDWEATRNCMKALRHTPLATVGRVLLALPRQVFTNKVVYRVTPNWDALSIPGFSLDSLNPAFVYIYDAMFNLVGTYPSYSRAIMFLSPIATQSMAHKRAERLSRGLQRACNWNKLVDTEYGKVYVARHPSRVTRNKST